MIQTFTCFTPSLASLLGLVIWSFLRPEYPRQIPLQLTSDTSLLRIRNAHTQHTHSPKYLWMLWCLISLLYQFPYRNDNKMTSRISPTSETSWHPSCLFGGNSQLTCFWKAILSIFLQLDCLWVTSSDGAITWSDFKSEAIFGFLSPNYTCKSTWFLS